MKRLLTVLGLAALVGVVGAIEAAYWFPNAAHAVQMRELQVPWQRAGYPASNDSSVALGRIRSTTFVAAATAQPIDTTAWIPLWEDIAAPNGVWTAADSVTCIFSVIPDNATASALGITTTADTIQVSVQASMDATNPVAVTSTQGLTFQQLETSSNNAVYKVVSVGRAWANDGTAPTNLQLLPYRYVRFIVTGDHVGVWQAWWKYPGPDKYGPYREHR